MSFEQATAVLTGIKRPNDNLTPENWNHTPNNRKLTQLKGHDSSPSSLIRRISTLGAGDLDGLTDKAKAFAANLVKYVLEATPKVTSKVPVKREELVTFLKHNKFSDVFGIKKRDIAVAEHTDATQEEIDGYLDRITERGVRTIPVHNPKRIRRREAQELCLRFFNHMKTLLRSDYPDNVIPIELFGRSIQSLVMTWGDIGTTKAVDYNNVDITFFYHTNAKTSAVSRHEASGHDLVVPTLNGLPTRRAARYFALPAVNFAKQHNHRYSVGQMHGVPPQYGYLGFDFNDMLPASNPVESVIIAQAREAGLFNEYKNLGQYTNTSTRFQRTGHEIFTGASRNAPQQ